MKDYSALVLHLTAKLVLADIIAPTDRRSLSFVLKVNILSHNNLSASTALMELHAWS